MCSTSRRPQSYCRYIVTYWVSAFTRIFGRISYQIRCSMGRSLQNIYKQHISKVLLNNVDSPKLQGTLVSRLLFSILSVYFSNHCSVGKWRETCSKKDISSSKFTWPVHQNCMEHWHMYNVRIPGPSKDIRIYWCSICSLVIIMDWVEEGGKEAR